MEAKQTVSDRNIIDMLRDDQSSGSKKNWKAFRDKLRLKRTGKAWTSSVPIPASDVPIQGQSGRMMTRRGSWRYVNDSDADVGESDGDGATQLGQMPERQRSGRLLPLETDPEQEGGDGSNGSNPAAGGGGDQHMSLMTLLSSDGSNYVEDEEEHVEGGDEVAEEGDEEEEFAGDCHVCSGCRGKHKGAALGPCGHTFCKRCTKELHIARGNCPTCNDFMLEILDIF